MAEQIGEIIHSNPVWRDQSNFIIAGPIQDGGDVKTEQLWARQLDDNRFEICCIPFFLYDVALGDIVETDADYQISRVVKQSGRYVFRVWLGDSSVPHDAIADELKDLDSLIEWSGPNLIAVDAIDEEHAQLVANFLAERHDSGQLSYEAGRS